MQWYTFDFTGPKAAYSLLGDRSQRRPTIDPATSPGGEASESTLRQRAHRRRRRVTASSHLADPRCRNGRT